MNYLAIDIGGTSIKYGLIDHEETLLEAHEMPTEAHLGGPHILEKVKELVESYLDDEGLAGVCISSAGMVDPDKGEIFYAGPQIPNYAGTQFKKEIETSFDIPCEIENDVNCAGLAEAVSGSAKGAQQVLCLTIGTGIGGCLVLNGEIFHGFSNSACEVGYLHLADGAFQDLASTTALVRYVAELQGDNPENWNGRRIFKEATEGNSHCIAGIDRMVDYLGQGIANICYVANPEVVVLGGGIMGQEAILKPKIEAALKKYLISSIAEKTKLAFAQHLNTAGMFGAYYHFKKKQKLI
ncbi:ROK family protein [Streptococcus massiliensis]|uniref:N-acetylmannosamine kinase transcriptional regulator, ROK family protein n=1 Tax=Streptococcus massiliensis TaxID=313439 RepID=A0A380L170_9STRE|nr:ROK family protein [Streptococcus massiliensis]SUN77094.1 N-acetylmannosamine kinase; transcriptional regulator, ROK family protein [Streptococcus massiliensis]